MSSKSDSGISPRTNALTILARIIAKDMVRKSVGANSHPEDIPKIPDRKAEPINQT